MEAGSEAACPAQTRARDQVGKKEGGGKGWQASLHGCGRKERRWDGMGKRMGRASGEKKRPE